MLRKLNLLVKLLQRIRNWPGYLFLYLGIVRGGSGILQIRSGEKFFCRNRSTDRNIVNEVFLQDLYPVPIGKDDVVVDIGAHIGVFSIHAAKHASNGRVLGFEPFPETFEVLSRNKALNSATNLEIHREAVSGEAGQAELFSGSDPCKNSLLSGATEKPDASTLVKVTSINDIFQRFQLDHIDILKVDCEGTEYSIFESIEAGNLSKVGKIMLEYHILDDRRNQYRLERLLEDNGFSVQLKPETERFGMIYADRSVN